jgi:hypothetical protein
LDVDSGQVGFTLEPSTGLVVAYSPGTGSVRPRVEAVTPKTPITITVTPAPDTVSATGEQAVTMTAADVVSPPLTVGLSDLTTPSDSVVPLPEKEVQFLVVFPDPCSFSWYFRIPAPPRRQAFSLRARRLTQCHNRIRTQCL